MFLYISDIDECIFKHLCVNGQCENTYGHFRCNCNQGYKLDQTGGNCTGNDNLFHVVTLEIISTGK